MLNVHIKRHASIHYVLIHVHIINAHKVRNAMWIIINRFVYILVSFILLNFKQTHLDVHEIDDSNAYWYKSFTGRDPYDCKHCSGGSCDPTTGACIKGNFVVSSTYVPVISCFNAYQFESFEELKNFSSSNYVLYLKTSQESNLKDKKEKKYETE